MRWDWKIVVCEGIGFFIEVDIKKIMDIRYVDDDIYD